MTGGNELTELEKKVLEAIRPSREEYETVDRVFARVKNTLDKHLNRHGVEAEVTLQGSIAKDTWLRGEKDLDVFVLFPRSWGKAEIKDIGFKIILSAAEDIGDYEVRYAEHPYVRVRIEGIEVDIVPAVKVGNPGDAKTTVDRTPFHTRYVIENLPPDKRDHVRLLKRFTKGVGVYGAEVKVRGFSGYLLELLVITYGGFREVLRKAASWKPPVYVNTLSSRDKHRFRDVVRELERRYPDSIMYAPDPTDPRRNTAAAVSLQSLAIFSTASRCYLAKPSIQFFFPKDRELEYNEAVDAVAMTGRDIVFIILPITKPIPPDNLWGELKRVADRLSKILMTYEFNVIYTSVWSDEKRLAVIGVELKKITETPLKLYRGPLFFSEWDRITSFIRKHIEKAGAGPWIGYDGALYAFSPRRYVHAIDLIVDRREEYLVSPDFKKIGPIITTIEGIEKLYKSIPELRKWVSRFISRKAGWMESCIGRI